MRRKVLLLAVIVLVLLGSCRSEYRADQYFVKLLTRIAAGTPPDVAYMDTLRAPQFIEQGLLQPLDDILDSRFTPEDREDFYPHLLANFQRNGHTYVIPHDFQTDAMAINTKVFDEKGVPWPNNDWTWDDLLAMATANTDGSVCGLGLTATMANWLPFVFQAGGRLLNDDGTQMDLNSQESIDALQYYIDFPLQGRGCIPEDGTWPYMGREQLLQRFLNDQLAMMVVDPGSFSYLISNIDGSNRPNPPILVVRLPKHPYTGKQTTIAYVVGYGLTNPPTESSISFLQYATSAEAMRLWFDSANGAPVEFIPARKSLVDEWKNAFGDESVRIAAQVFVDSVEDVGGYQPATASFGQIAEFDLQADQILLQALTNQKSASDAVQEIHDLGNSILAQNQ